MVEATAISSRSRTPDLIPGYRLERLVGKGGMGEVHRGVQLSLGRTVAIKVLNADLAMDPSFVVRFEKEAAALAALSHPNIVSIVDKGNVHQTYYLVMELVDGPSLREVMRSPLLDLPKTLRMALEICRAVEYAHGRGVIHRDLKPENILFDEQAGGIPKVTDFGLAGFVDSDSKAGKYNLTETHIAMGTAAYMAPEQRLDAKNADGRADIYSLGIILYELLTGHVPVGAYEPPSRRQPKLDRRLDAIVARCLKPAPEDRYSDVTELMRDLEPLTPYVHFTTSTAPLKPMERLALQARVFGQKILRAVALAIVVAAAGVLVVSYARGKLIAERPSAGSELTAPDLLFQTARTVPAKITVADPWHTLLVGPGSESAQVVAQGRPVNLDVDNGTFTFAAPPGGKWAGRAQLDVVDLDSVAASFSAEVSVLPGTPSFLARLKHTFLGTKMEGRAALLLVGGHGRYAALVVPGYDKPMLLEWSLGDRRGTMIGPPVPAGNELKLALRVDREGHLTAHFGSLEGQGMKPVGEAVQLGTHWKEYFGKPPSPALGCLEQLCTFARVRYELEREPPPVAEAGPPAMKMPAFNAALPTPPLRHTGKKPGRAPSRRSR